MFSLDIERAEPLSREFRLPQRSTWNSPEDAFNCLALMGAPGRRADMEEAMQGDGFEFTCFASDFSGEHPVSRYRVKFADSALPAAA